MREERKFLDDGRDLVIAIKQREEILLIDRFQKYWKERCNNEQFLLQTEVLSVLMYFAKDNFTSSDWYKFNEYFRLHNIFKNGKKVSLDSLIDGYLVAIDLMLMVYDV